MEEVIENIKDAIRGCLESLDKDLISPQKDQVFVEVAI
jgi:predicted RNase H-like HicB family nuclease